MSLKERCGKIKHLEACLEILRHFTPLMLSVYGFMGDEKKVATNQLVDDL